MSSGYYSYVFKFIIIGDMGVGKSCFMHQFTENTFLPDCPHTIGVEFGSKVIELRGIKIKLQIWDTAGQERFRAVTRSYYRGATGAIVVYDITRRSTYNHVSNWLTDARNLTNPNIVIYMIGNKADLEDEREVTFEEARKFADENGIKFLETSAKSGDNVVNVFWFASSMILQLIDDRKIDIQNPGYGIKRQIEHADSNDKNNLNSVKIKTISDKFGQNQCSC